MGDESLQKYCFRAEGDMAQYKKDLLTWQTEIQTMRCGLDQRKRGLQSTETSEPPWVISMAVESSAGTLHEAVRAACKTVEQEGFADIEVAVLKGAK